MDLNSFKYQKEGAACDLVELLMKEYELDMEKAFDILYNSETYSKIIEPMTGLYFQSSEYLYSILKNEIETGAMS